MKRKGILIGIAAGSILLLAAMPGYAAETASAEEPSGEVLRLPVTWYKESGSGNDAVQTELTDDEAMWWDDNQREKAMIEIPVDHAVAVSSSEGAALWTPYTLPKHTDTSEGMPLIAYDFYYGDHEIGRFEVEDRHSVFVQACPEETNGAYEMEPGIRISDNPDMEDAVIIRAPGKGYQEEKEEMSLRIVYRERRLRLPGSKGGEQRRDGSSASAGTGTGGVSSIQGFAQTGKPFLWMFIIGIIIYRVGRARIDIGDQTGQKAETEVNTEKNTKKKHP